MRALRIGNKVLAKKVKVEPQPSNIEHTQQKYVNPRKGYIRMDDETLEIVPNNIQLDITSLPRDYYTYANTSITNTYFPSRLDFENFIDSFTKGDNK